MNEEVRSLCKRIQDIDLEREELIEKLNELTGTDFTTANESNSDAAVSSLEVIRGDRQRIKGRATTRIEVIVRGESLEQQQDIDRYVDSEGNQLQAGDRVRFLTKGVYRSRIGTITNFGKKRATCIDEQGNITNRAYKNLKLIQGETENEQ